MAHLNSFLAREGGNLNKNFSQIQMPVGLPGGGMLKLRFDWYIKILLLMHARFQFMTKYVMLSHLFYYRDLSHNHLAQIPTELLLRTPHLFKL